MLVLKIPSLNPIFFPPFKKLLSKNAQKINVGQAQFVKKLTRFKLKKLLLWYKSFILLLLNL